MLKTYGKQYPRLTKISTFHEADARAVAVKNLAIAYDPVKGYLGYGVKGEGLEPAFRCSELDRVLTVTADGRYRVHAAAGKTVRGPRPVPVCAVLARPALHARVSDARRDVPEAVHVRRHDPQQGIPLRPAEVENPVADHRVAGARLHQIQAFQAGQARRPGKDGSQPDEQIVELADLPVQTPRQLGTLLSHKAVDWLKTTRPRGWNESGGPPMGPLFS